MVGGDGLVVGGGEPPEPDPEPDPEPEPEPDPEPEPEPEPEPDDGVVVVGDDPPDPELPEPPPEAPVLDCPLELGAVLGATVVGGTVDVGPSGPMGVVGDVCALDLCEGDAAAVPELLARVPDVVVGASATMVGVVDAWAAGGRATSTPAKAPPTTSPTRRLSAAPTRTALRIAQRRGTSSSRRSIFAPADARNGEAAVVSRWRACATVRRVACSTWLRLNRRSSRVSTGPNPVVSLIPVDRAFTRACTRPRPSSAAHSKKRRSCRLRGGVPLDWTFSIARRIGSTRARA